MTAPTSSPRTSRPATSRRRLWFLAHLGPGLITGAADDDPSGIGTYSQIGAQFGLGMLWTTVVSLPLAAAVEELAGRLGLCGRKGLATLIKQNLPAPALYISATLVAGANIFNIGADLGSMAAALHLVVPLPVVALLITASGLLLAVEVFLSYHRYARILRYTTLVLLSYIAVLAVVHVSWGAVVRNLIPQLRWEPAYLAALIAVFGTTISPYLMYWQASEEVEEALDKNHVAHQETRGAVRGMRIDVAAGMTAAVIVMFSIIVSTATTLNLNGITDVGTADEAAQALRPIAGDLAGLLFALGIIGTGALAIPVLAASTGYALAETFGWHEGLSLTLRRGRAFYMIIAGSMLIGVALNFLGINPIKALVYSAILNGLAAPALILFMLILGNRRTVIGRWRSRWLSNVLVGTALVVMTGLPIAYLIHH